MDCPPDLLDFAGELADAVGDVHRRHFRRPVAVETKGDGTPVTQVDKEAERLVRDMVESRYPDHGVIGEEYEATRPDAEWVWVVDPLDGTRLFLLGIPQFALLVGLAHRGRFLLGMIDQAVVGDRWLGADGHGTTLNGRRVSTRACASLGEAVVARPGLKDHTLGRDAMIDTLAAQARLVHWGSSPCDYGLVAAGFIDLAVAAGPKLHDLAPLDPIIRNAGGRVSDWEGRRLDLHSSDYVLAAGDPGLIDAAIAALRA